MNRIRKDNKGVSPVIATILMVAITVVLAGVLVVYLQTLPSSGGTVETNLGVRAEKNTNGDWLISVITGSKDSTGVRISVTNPTDGTTRFAPLALRTGAVDANTADVIFHDNNANFKVDAGDSIVLPCVTNLGHSVAGDKVSFMKGDSIVGTIGSLPS